MLVFSGQIHLGADPGRDPGRGKNRLQRVTLLWETSSDRIVTATDRMHRNNLKACGKKCCYFWFHSEVKFLTPFWRLFGLSHFGIFSCNFYGVLCIEVLNLHLLCAVFMYISFAMLIFKIWAYKEFLCRLRLAERLIGITLSGVCPSVCLSGSHTLLSKLLQATYVFLEHSSLRLYFVQKGGRGAYIHVHVWEPIFSLFSRTALWIFTKLMVLHKCCCFSARSAQWGKNRLRRSPYFEKLLHFAVN